MQFHEVRFPTALSFGSIGGPERRTEIVTLANGHEERNTPWKHSRRRYDAGIGLRSMDDLARLTAFFEARQGPLIGFRWKDWTDWKSCLPSGEITPFDQEIGIGDEVRSVFALIKRYRSGDTEDVRPIAKPVTGSVRVALGEVELQETVDYAIDYKTGSIEFFHPPEVGGEITAGYEFDVPARFDGDAIAISAAAFDAGEVPSVPVVEVRL